MARMTTLTPQEAKAFYDRFGARQDRQSFYEAAALEQLVAHGDFGGAKHVFEFGCGTGRFAFDLLRHHLPETASYRATDISTTMVELASARLAEFAPRASVTTASGDIAFPLPDGSVDRVIATYVLDLLSDGAIDRFLGEARRVLQPDGLLCVVGITFGTSPLSRTIMRGWQWLFTQRPSWVGGCRPSEIQRRLSSAWRIRFRTVVVAWGIASEVVIAHPVGISP
jgi:ubiquinone/menaquinone biosynthesis C-methylase UbiE